MVSQRVARDWVTNAFFLFLSLRCIPVPHAQHLSSAPAALYVCVRVLCVHVLCVCVCVCVCRGERAGVCSRHAVQHGSGAPQMRWFCSLPVGNPSCVPEPTLLPLVPPLRKLFLRRLGAQDIVWQRQSAVLWWFLNPQAPRCSASGPQVSVICLIWSFARDLMFRLKDLLWLSLTCSFPLAKRIYAGFC